MTRPEAQAQALALAKTTGDSQTIYAHVGGPTPKGMQLPSGRHLVRPADKPAPKFGVWQAVETVAP